MRFIAVITLLVMAFGCIGANNSLIALVFVCDGVVSVSVNEERQHTDQHHHQQMPTSNALPVR